MHPHTQKLLEENPLHNRTGIEDAYLISRNGGLTKIREDFDLTATDVYVLRSLIQYHQGGHCLPSQETIAYESGVLKRTVQLVTKRLENLGLITRTKKPYQDSRGRWRTGKLYHYTFGAPVIDAIFDEHNQQAHLPVEEAAPNRRSGRAYLAETRQIGDQDAPIGRSGRAYVGDQDAPIGRSGRAYVGDQDAPEKLEVEGRKKLEVEGRKNIGASGADLDKSSTPLRPPDYFYSRLDDETTGGRLEVLRSFCREYGVQLPNEPLFTLDSVRGFIEGVFEANYSQTGLHG